jgi:hypothetical protein
VPDDFVIGIALQSSATAYYFDLAAGRRVTNDRIGKHPMAVFADPDSRDIKAYLRRVATDLPGDPAPAELVFEIDGQGLVKDVQSGSVWDTTRGVAIGGPLKGTVLQQIPYVTAFDWAWLDFFPNSSFYDVEDAAQP